MGLARDLIAEALTATVTKALNKAKAREKVTTAAVVSTTITKIIVLMTTVRVDTIGIIVAVKADVVEVNKLLNSSVRRLITHLRKLSFVAR
ncbi:hypothetical protein D3C75_1011250 [compost metagenome]